MKKNEYYIYVNNKPIEVSKRIYTEYWKSIEEERYLTKRIRRTWIYLDHLFDEYERNSLEYYLIDDLNPTKEEVDKKIQIELLLKEIAKLDKDEKDLIDALYYQGLSQTDYAMIIGDYQQNIGRKHQKIIEKLKNRLK